MLKKCIFLIVLLFTATITLAEEKVNTLVGEKKEMKLDEIVVTATRTEKEISERGDQ